MILPVLLRMLRLGFGLLVLVLLLFVMVLLCRSVDRAAHKQELQFQEATTECLYW
jgi:hypothetical protein